MPGPNDHRKPEHYLRLQKAFVESWHRLPATLPKTVRAHQAALNAGYSARTARSAGAKLLEKPQILEQILTTSTRALAERSGIDAVWVLNELADLWETPLSALFADDGTLLPIDQLPSGAQKLLAGFEITEEVAVENGRRTVTTRVGKIKLIDRLGIMEKIARHHIVSAYTSPEQKAAEQSIARMWRALEKAAVDRALPDPVDVTAVSTTTKRSLADVFRAQDDRGAEAEGSE